jgi:Heparinase II/III-like protein/Heparinase II/III N-terminus
MSPGEMIGRARDELVKRRWRHRRVRQGAHDPFVPPAHVPAVRLTLPAGAARNVDPSARACLLRAADELLGGQWQVFARTRDDLAPAPDWFLDPRTGVRAPSDVYCFDIDHRDEAAVGNVKYVWELSRHQHTTVLAAAYHLSGDERFAQAVARQLTSWWEANPFLSGIHWTSAIELGVRLISWVWVRRLLEGWAGVRALFEDNPTFLRQLHHHQEYLASFPSRGSSANNHLLAEAAGQFVAACAFPFFAESARWREGARATLRLQIPRQTFASGLNRELASDYHGFVLELGLAAAIEGEAAGHGLGAAVWETLRRMVDALAAVVDARLHPPRQGDADDGHGLLLDRLGYQRWASLLATGAVLFGSLDWWPRVTAEDVRTSLWTSLLPAPPVVRGVRPARRPSLFADAGMVLLRDPPGTPHELWCRADSGPHGYPAIAAHAHADALSVEVRAGGVDLLADPGTYCYHGEPIWRSYFRSTLGHNTLEVDGVDQSSSGGPFLWIRQAGATTEHVAGLDDGPVATWRGVHDGYTRLRPPVRHRRSVRLERSRRRLVIEDVLAGEGTHEVRLAFHLGPRVACALDGACARLAWSVEGGDSQAQLSLPPTLRWSCARGGTDPPAGWFSPHFDVRVPSATLVGAGRVACGQTLTTALQIEHPPSIQGAVQGAVPGGAS